MNHMTFEIEESDAEVTSEAVKALRKSTGLTQREFSAKYGIPQRTFQEWESGRRTPPTYVFRMLVMYVKYYEVMQEEKEEM